MPPTSSKATTHVDVTYRGRSPCGRYNRARILETSLRRSSLPEPKKLALSTSGSVSASSCPSLKRTSTSSSPSSSTCTEPISPPSTPPMPSAYPLHCSRPPVLEPPKAPTATSPISIPAEPGRLGGLRRIFGYGRKPTNEAKSALKPLVLPNRLGLSHTRTSSALAEPAASVSRAHLKTEKDGHRTSLAGWLPGLTSPPLSPSLSSARDPSSRLRPLELGKRSASNGDPSSAAPPSSERANMLAWLLDCVARDIKPHWSVVPWGDVNSDERAKRMVLGNGQARCLVVRQKRRSALF